jgi:hypothetical protein
VEDGREMVGLGRLELPTSPLSGVRSSHLSYRPKSRQGISYANWGVRQITVQKPFRGWRALFKRRASAPICNRARLRSDMTLRLARRELQHCGAAAVTS